VKELNGAGNKVAIITRADEIRYRAAFKEQISLTTDNFRVTDIVGECAEAIIASAIGKFKAVLNATAGIRDSLNQSLSDIKRLEHNTSARIDCALAMLTRDDYMRTMLRGANLSTCADFSIPGVYPN
jgi:hypothetical protein